MMGFYQRADDDSVAVKSYRYGTVSIPHYHNEGCREDDRWLCRDGAGDQRRGASWTAWCIRQFCQECIHIASTSFFLVDQEYVKIGDWHDVHTEDALFKDTELFAVTEYPRRA